jgi:hypothetical protein
MFVLEHETSTSFTARAPVEKRRNVRIPVQRLTISHQGISYSGAGNLSAGGALWRGVFAPPAATVVQVEVDLPPGKEGKQRFWAEIVRRRKAGPLHFVHLRLCGGQPQFDDALAKLTSRALHGADLSDLFD